MTALVSLSAGGAITGFSFVPKAAADLASPASVPVHLMALEQSARAAPGRGHLAQPARDEMLRSAIVNVAGHYLRLAAGESPARMEALIWQQDSIDHADHGASCAAFASLTLELGAHAVGQQSWVTGGTSYPWPLHKWADVRVDPNPDSPGITSILQDAQAHNRWHALGDGYRPLPGDWVLFDNHVEVVTGYEGGVLHTIGGDSLPNFSVNAHEYAGPLGAQGVGGFVNNGAVSGAGAPSAGAGQPQPAQLQKPQHPKTQHPKDVHPRSDQAKAAAGSPVPAAGGTIQDMAKAAGPPPPGGADIPGVAAQARPRQGGGDASRSAPASGGGAEPRGRPATPGGAAGAAPHHHARAAGSAADGAQYAGVPGAGPPWWPQATGTAARGAAAIPGLAPPGRQHGSAGRGRPGPGDPGPRASQGHPGAGAARAGVGQGHPGSGGAGSGGAAAGGAAAGGAGSGGAAAGGAGSGGAAAGGSGGGHGRAAPAPYRRHQPGAFPTLPHDTQAQQAFIQSVVPGALAAQHRYGVPAAVTIAQAIEESGWGRSSLATSDHNLFGIKGTGPAGSVPLRSQEYENGRWVTRTASFRVYHNVAESISDHGALLATSGYYQAAMAVRHDPNAFATALTGVYATDPGYGAKLIALMRRYDLYRYDAGISPAARHAAAPSAPRTGAGPGAAGTGPRSHPHRSVDGSGPRHPPAAGGADIPGLPRTGSVHTATSPKSPPLAPTASGASRLAGPGTRQQPAGYDAHIPHGVAQAFTTTAKVQLVRAEPFYTDIASQHGLRWELLAACDWMQCKAHPRRSPVHGERLGTVNLDGTAYRTRSEALAQCADDLVRLAHAVYAIDVTGHNDLSVRELANVFAAFRWGGLLRQHRTSAMEFPYSVAGLTERHLSMRWPNIAEPDAPDKPGGRFRMPFGAVPLLLMLHYPATA